MGLLCVSTSPGREGAFRSHKEILDLRLSTMPSSPWFFYPKNPHPHPHSKPLLSTRASWIPVPQMCGPERRQRTTESRISSQGQIVYFFIVSGHAMQTCFPHFIWVGNLCSLSVGSVPVDLACHMKVILVWWLWSFEFSTLKRQEGLCFMGMSLGLGRPSRVMGLFFVCFCFRSYSPLSM